MAWSLNELGRVYLLQDRISEAEATFFKALEKARQLDTNDRQIGAILTNLSRLRLRQGHYAQAEELLIEALDRYRPTLGNEHIDTAGVIALLALSLILQEKFVAAEQAARESLRTLETHTPDNWLTFKVRSLLGQSLLAQRKHQEAEAFLLAGFTGMTEREVRMHALAKPRIKETILSLVQLYQETGRPEQVARWTKKLDGFHAAAP